MLSYNESLKLLKETNALLEGHFILSSGLHSSKYIQCAKLLSYPKASKKICASLSQKIKEKYKKIDLILSPALGGVVIGYELGRQLNVETIFAERVNGIFQLRRGFRISKHSRVLLIEDVITTGKSILECSKLVIKSNANILGYACLIDRSNKNLLIKGSIISQIKMQVPTFKVSEIPEKLKKIPAIKPGSRNLK